MVFSTRVQLPWRRRDTCTMSGGCCPTRRSEPVERRKSFSRSNALTSMPSLQAVSSKNSNSPWPHFPPFPFPGGCPQFCLRAAGFSLLPVPWIEPWAAELSNLLFGGSTQWCFVCCSFILSSFFLVFPTDGYQRLKMVSLLYQKKKKKLKGDKLPSLLSIFLSET